MLFSCYRLQPGCKYAFTSEDSFFEFRLKKKVVPGDQIVLEAEVIHVFSHLAKVKVLARVGEERVAEGLLVLAKGQNSKL